MKNVRLFLLVLLLGLAGCPASNDTSNEDSSDDERDLGEISADPPVVAIREDTETLLITKNFPIGAGTDFPEAISGVSIEVGTTPDDECPAGDNVSGAFEVTDCESWQLTAMNAASASYAVGALVPRILQGAKPRDVTEVLVYPEGRGSAAIIKATAGGRILLARDGAVLTDYDETLAKGERFYGPRVATMTIDVPTDQLPPDVVDVSATPIENFRPPARFEGDTEGDTSASYGLALTTDNRIFEWGWRQKQVALFDAETGVFELDFSPFGTGVFEPTEEAVERERQVIRDSLVATTREMNELAEFASRNNAQWTQVVAVDRPPIAGVETEYGDVLLAFRTGVTGMALAADGRVAIWGDPVNTYFPERELGDDLNRLPLWLGRAGDIQQISSESGGLVVLSGAGQVAFDSGRSIANRGRAIFVDAVPGLPAGTTVQIAGMRARMRDGSVWQWRMAADGSPTVAQRVPGITDAVDLPDPNQNLAILADGTMMSWDFEASDSVPSGVRPFPLPGVGSVAAVSGDVVIDSECGRGWHRLVDSQSEQVEMIPMVGLGGADTCNAGARSHIVQVIIMRDEKTSFPLNSVFVTSPDGPVFCADTMPRRCWWLGDPSQNPTFEVQVDSDTSRVRDWRWDCGSMSERSLPVLLRSDGEPGSANLCKVTITGDGPFPFEDPPGTLLVEISGRGSVVDSLSAIDCGTDCTATLPAGTRLTLTATPDTGAAFSNWADTGCTDDRANPVIVVAVSGEVTCRAIFEDIVVGNVPPVARFTIDPITMVSVGQTITLNASASADPDGSIISWAWDLNADGVADASGEVVDVSFATAGQQEITLTVTDNEGLTASLSQGLIVSAGLSAPPVASFTISPSNRQLAGSTFNFDASASTDDVGIVSYEWDLSANGSFEGSGVTYSVRIDDVGIRQMRLRVTDADGQFSDQLQDVIAEPPPPPTGEFSVVVRVQGSGQVQVEPLGRTLLDSECDGDSCFLTEIPSGTTLTLTASPFTPTAFAGWTTPQCDNIPDPDTCEIIVTSNREVVAVFN